MEIWEIIDRSIGFELSFLHIVVVTIFIIGFFNVIYKDNFQNYPPLFSYYYKLKAKNSSNFLNKFFFAIKHTFRKELSTSEIEEFIFACQNGDLQFIKNLLKKKRCKLLSNHNFHYSFTKEFLNAAKGGHLHILKYFHNSARVIPFFKLERGTIIENLIVNSIENGHFDTVIYLSDYYSEYLYPDHPATKCVHLRNFVESSIKHKNYPIMYYFINSFKTFEELAKNLEGIGYYKSFEEHQKSDNLERILYEDAFDYLIPKLNEETRSMFEQFLEKNDNSYHFAGLNLIIKTALKKYEYNLLSAELSSSVSTKRKLNKI